MLDRLKQMGRRSLLRGVVCGLAAIVAMPIAAKADEWPDKPITIIVPFGSGGSTDRSARALASFLPNEIGQPVTVINKSGGGGQLGHTWFLQQPDDGSVFLFTSGSPYIGNNILHTGAKFELSDFAFINAQWVDWDLIACHKDRPWKTLVELLEHIKANPKTVSISNVLGSSGRLTIASLMEGMGLPDDAVNVVVYQGGAKPRTAVAGGQVDCTVIGGEGSTEIAEFINPLAVVREEPHPDWDAPIVNEALKPLGFEVPLINGGIRTMTASAAFKEKHPDRFKKIVDAVEKTVKSDDFQKFAKRSQLGAEWHGPEKTDKMVEYNFKYLKKYSDLVK